MFSLNLRRRLYILPIVTAIFCVLSFCITYVVAASLGHVELAFPYISYTGIATPERGIFGQLLNIGALLLGLNAYLRYLRLQRIKTVSSTLNKAGFIMGLSSAFGISMVANFETKVMRAPHYVGAFLGFGVAGIYCWLHTIISWKRRHDPVSRPRFTFLYQLIVSSMLTFWTIVFVASKIVYKLYDNEEERRKYPGPVRTAYLISTSGEWCLAISLMSFLFSFIPDFRNVEIRGPEFIVIGCNKTTLLDDTDARANDLAPHTDPDTDQPESAETHKHEVADVTHHSLMAETDHNDASPV